MAKVRRKAAMAKSVVAAIVGAALSLAGCAPEKGTASGVAVGTQESSCSSLIESRRKLAVQIDDVESGRASPGTWKDVLFAVGALNAPYYQQSVLRSARDKERTKALDEMRGQQTELTQQIEQKQCTAVARAKAGAIRAVDGAQQDGDYSGKAQTDSWCTQPLVTLRLKSGHLSGGLRPDNMASEAYEISGQLYDDGTLSLNFMRPQSRQYTDNFDGILKDGVLSFSAKLDLSSKGCAYRFTAVRNQESQPAPATASAEPPTKTYTGPWTANLVLIADRSAGVCQGFVPYKFNLADQTLTGANENGQLFSVLIMADGTVDTTFKSPTGNTYRLTGNARTRDLILTHTRLGCSWHLDPS